MKILFLVPYPTEGPSNRYRVEQYLPYLKERDIDYSLRPFIYSSFFKILYKKGNLEKKMLYFLAATQRRFSDAINSFKYDLIFVHIESFPFGPAILEWFFSKLGKPIIYDFEDAVYLPNFKRKNKFMNFLHYPEKFFKILKLSSHVIVCNKYMKELVYSYNKNVTVIPTSIDTDKFLLKQDVSNNKIPVIGWIGSHTTFLYLKQIFPVFQKLSEKHNFVLKVVGAGRDKIVIPGVKVINENWSIEREVDNFYSLDIGVYPLCDNEESKAKTPFKTIQYMAVGIPTVALNVSGNKEIIQDGINGFLVSTEKEWFDRLSLLIKKPEVRRTIGLSGRKTVEEKYSLKISAPKFFEVIRKVYYGRYRSEL